MRQSDSDHDGSSAPRRDHRLDSAVNEVAAVAMRVNLAKVMREPGPAAQTELHDLVA